MSAVLGRPSSCSPTLLAQIIMRRMEGARLSDICAELNSAGIATPGGGCRWWPSHLSRLLRTRAADRMRRTLLENPLPAAFSSANGDG